MRGCSSCDSWRWGGWRLPSWAGAGVLSRNPGWSLSVLVGPPVVVDLGHGERILIVVRAGILPRINVRLRILLRHPVKVAVFGELLPGSLVFLSDQLRILPGSMIFVMVYIGAVR